MLRLSGYAGKRRALDTFWSSKVGLSPEPEKRKSTIIGMSDGKFSSRGGYRIPPLKAFKASASRFGVQVQIPEKYTTLVCSSCHGITEPVMMKYHKKRRGECCYTRCGQKEMVSRVCLGLRRCCSNECRTIPLKRRDVDAVLSQMQILKSQENPRPEAYTREGVEARRMNGP